MNAVRNSGLFRQAVSTFLGRGVVIKICLGIILIFILSALFAPLLTPYTPYEQDLAKTFAGISAEHPLGTDNLGRDLLTRLLYGARLSLATSLFASMWAAAAGTVLGLIAGYFKGFISHLIMRIIDAQLSIPPLILTMVMAMVIGQNMAGLSIILGIGAIPAYTRLVYGMVLSLKEKDFVIASSLVGQSKRVILFKHLLPNCFAPIIVVFTMGLGQTIMIEAGLAYLGVGIAPPTPAWGVMVSEGYTYLLLEPRLAILPGLCIMLVVISFNIVGDGLRDALDPKLRGKL